MVEDTQVIILMGVSGSGKTTVGRELAALIHWPFYDGDDFHPPANISKMRAGSPLTDADRAAWLDALVSLLAEAGRKAQPLVLACSALKVSYRERLQSAGLGGVQFIFLDGDSEVLRQRLAARTGHFFKASLLDSQLETLEVPCEALPVDFAQAPAVLAREIKRRLNIG